MNLALANQDLSVSITGPGVVCPNEQNISYSASVSDSEGTVSYDWSETHDTSSSTTYDAPDSGTFTVSCTVSDDNDSATGTKNVNVCNVTSLLPPPTTKRQL